MIGVKWLGGAGMLAVAAVLVAGCSTQSSSSSTGSAAGAPSPSTASSSAAAPASTTSSAATPSPASTPSPAGTSTAAPPVTSPAKAGEPACATKSLVVSVAQSGAAAGSQYVFIRFKNASAATCTLFGYPGVALARGGASPSQVGAAATRSPFAPPAVVTLKPGQAGSAQLQIANTDNYPASTCDPTTANALQVFPPNQVVPVLVSIPPRTGCASRSVSILVVGVVQPGMGS